MKYYKEINGEVMFFEGNILQTEQGIIVNPTEEQMLANGWFVWIEPAPTDEQLLANAKNAKIEDIEDYDNSESVNVFYLGSTPMWLDAATRQQLRISIEAYRDSDIANVTKWFNGVPFTFSVQLWLQMLNALEIYASEALNTTESHKAAVSAMTDIDNVESYDITVGYPTVIHFNSNQD